MTFRDDVLLPKQQTPLYRVRSDEEARRHSTTGVLYPVVPVKLMRHERIPTRNRGQRGSRLGRRSVVTHR